jgi:hypothetical protein
MTFFAPQLFCEEKVFFGGVEHISPFSAKQTGRVASKSTKNKPANLEKYTGKYTNFYQNLHT